MCIRGASGIGKRAIALCCSKMKKGFGVVRTLFCLIRQCGAQRFDRLPPPIVYRLLDGVFLTTDIGQGTIFDVVLIQQLLLFGCEALPGVRKSLAEVFRLEASADDGLDGLDGQRVDGGGDALHRGIVGGRECDGIDGCLSLPGVSIFDE